MLEEGTVRVSTAGLAESFDLLVIAVGYEERSRQVGEQLADRAIQRVAFAFPSAGTLSFDANVRFATDAGFDLFALADDFPELFEGLIEGLRGERVRIAIDISSFTRLHLAEMLDVLRNSKTVADVDFLYSPASSDGWSVHGSPIRVAEPIHPAFASWVDDPAQPLIAIIGVGVEENLALGVAEYLDVSGVYAFSPFGSDAGFDEMGRKANHEFFLADYVARSSQYDLTLPFDLFTRLESLIYGLRGEFRIALVPLGPKLFALCALLAAMASNRAPTVWRFSSEVPDNPTEVRATGEFVSLRVRFGGTLEASDA